LAALLFLGAVLTGCADSRPPPAAATTTPQAEWRTAGGDTQLTRHSTLSQITPANVALLQPAWQFATGAPRGQEGNPLVVDGLMLFHTPYPNDVIALRLADHSVAWRYHPTQDERAPALMCCDHVSRGLATGDGLVVMQQADTTLVALDLKTGQERWKVSNGDPAQGETATGAPLIAGHIVITGIAGGEYGVRGHLTAYDLATGRRLWRGYSAGPDADLLVDPEQTTTWHDGRPQPIGRDSSLKTWKGDQWQRGGTTTWGWIAWDPALDLIYYGTGNPGTWNPVQRPGDNRWSLSIVARDRKTGVMRWVYQMTPHDEWDYDGVNEPILIDLPGKTGEPPRPLLGHFDRNGYAYLLDRATGALVKADKFDPSVNWASHVDLHTGRPQVVAARSPQAQGEDTTTEDVCPAAIGVKNQAPAAWDPALQRFFVPTAHLCMDIEPFEVDYTAGQPYIGASYTLKPVPGDEQTLGRLVAWDAAAGREAWRIDEPLPLWGGVLTTASGLVFYGTLDGHLKAADARTGQVLWQSPKLPSGVVGNVMTWQWAGRQFVGVLTGIGGLANDPEGIGKLGQGRLATGPSKGVFVAYALP